MPITARAPDGSSASSTKMASIARWAMTSIQRMPTRPKVSWVIGTYLPRSAVGRKTANIPGG